MMPSLVLQIQVLSIEVFANILNQNQEVLELPTLRFAQIGTIRAIRLPQRILSSPRFQDKHHACLET
jgi:hypothetical protein